MARPHVEHGRGPRAAISTARASRARAALRDVRAARAHTAQRSALLRRFVGAPQPMQRPFAVWRSMRRAWRACAAPASPQRARVGRAHTGPESLGESGRMETRMDAGRGARRSSPMESASNREGRFRRRRAWMENRMAEIFARRENLVIPSGCGRELLPLPGRVPHRAKAIIRRRSLKRRTTHPSLQYRRHRQAEPPVAGRSNAPPKTAATARARKLPRTPRSAPQRPFRNELSDSSRLWFTGCGNQPARRNMWTEIARAKPARDGGRHARLRAVAAPMGRRTDTGLAEPSPASGQGLRGDHRHGAGMALHRKRAAPHTQNGKNIKATTHSGTGSQTRDVWEIRVRPRPVLAWDGGRNTARRGVEDGPARPAPPARRGVMTAVHRAAPAKTAGSCACWRASPGRSSPARAPTAWRGWRGRRRRRKSWAAFRQRSPDVAAKAGTAPEARASRRNG